MANELTMALAEVLRKWSSPNMSAPCGKSALLSERLPRAALGCARGHNRAAGAASSRRQLLSVPHLAAPMTRKFGSVMSRQV
jgi:hypothetical protein